MISVWISIFLEYVPIIVGIVVYLLIGFFIALFAFDNPPRWISNSSIISTIIFWIIVLIWGPIILITLVWIGIGLLYHAIKDIFTWKNKS